MKCSRLKVWRTLLSMHWPVSVAATSEPAARWMAGFYPLLTTHDNCWSSSSALVKHRLVNSGWELRSDARRRRHYVILLYIQSILCLLSLETSVLFICLFGEATTPWRHLDSQVLLFHSFIFCFLLVLSWADVFVFALVLLVSLGLLLSGRVASLI